MSLQDAYDFDFLVNDAERFVLEELEEQLSNDTENKICKCQECILDMAAYALNHVRPAYRASLVGKLYSNALGGTEYDKEISAAASLAIDKVRKNPMHE